MPTTPAHLRVLSVGSDDTLLWVRELVLKRIGYSVFSASPSQVSARDVDYDIIVLCRSIAIETAGNLARNVKAEHPATRIVRLSSFASADDAYFDTVCDPTCGPVKLLAELKRWSD